MKVLKTYFALLFIPIILAGSLNFPMVYLEFELNKDYIINELCVNRTKPITVCGGSCYLQDRLESENANSQATSPETKRAGLALFFEEIDRIFVAHRETEEAISEPEPNYSFSFSASIFHPPTTAIV